MAAETRPSPKRGNSIVLDGEILDIDRQLSPPNILEKNANFVAFAPPQMPKYDNPASIFLAGSIEMGKAIQWQEQLTKELQDLAITVCNPRRGQWSTDPIPGAADALFNQQVEWELAALEKVDAICFFFDKNTLSPVTMLELGLWVHSGKVVVCCHKDFWKSGNIHHVCKKYNVPFVMDYADLITVVRQKLDGIAKKNDSNALNVKLANELRAAREEEREVQKKEAAALPTTEKAMIHRYLKYLRPARKAFETDMKGLDQSEQERLWNQLCSSK